MTFDEQWARKRHAELHQYPERALILAREAYERGIREARTVTISPDAVWSEPMPSPPTDYAALFREYAGLAMQSLIRLSPMTPVNEDPHAIVANAARLFARALVEAVRESERQSKREGES